MADGPVSYDPAEMERAAHVLTKTREALRQQVSSMRSAMSSMPRFKGQEADRFRAEVERNARALDNLSASIEDQSRALRRLAQQVRDLRLR